MKTTVNGVKEGYNKILLFLLAERAHYNLENCIPVDVFSLLWHGAVSELSEAAEMVLKSKARGLIASRTDLSGATRRRLSAIDDRQHRIANEVS